MTFILGVTGGIASGKSTVVKLFEELNYPIVDSDQIARKIVSLNQPALKKISEVFGSEFLRQDGTLNREKLGALIFSNGEKRIELDQLLAPYLREAIQKEISEKSRGNQLVIADIPLLYEAGYTEIVTAVAVVYVPEEIQCERLMLRNNYTEKEALARIHSQLSIEEKKKQADIVFDNSKTIADTKKQVYEWLENQMFLTENML